MLTPELMAAVMEERVREAMEVRRQHEAQELLGEGAAPRRGLSLKRISRLPVLSFVAHRFWTASVS